jgi:hypothetical protein
VFLPTRPITQVHLAALTERVRRRVVRWFRMQQLLRADAAADMLAWKNNVFSVDASVRITLIDRDVPSYFRSLEHVLRFCARPPFALERLSVIRGPDGRGAKVRSVLPWHKAANWERRPAVTALAIGNIGKLGDAAAGGHAVGVVDKRSDAAEAVGLPGLVGVSRGTIANQIVIHVLDDTLLAIRSPQKWNIATSPGSISNNEC